MKKQNFVEIAVALLVLLWVYTAVSKMANPMEFQHQLNNQVFSAEVANALFYLIPAIELATAGTLLYKPLITFGLVLSLLLMVIFTFYISLILAGYYDRVPCSCGGVLSAMGWKSHLLFNLFFTAVAAIGFILTLKERREVKTS